MLNKHKITRYLANNLFDIAREMVGYKWIILDPSKIIGFNLLPHTLKVIGLILFSDKIGIQLKNFQSK